MTKNIVLFAFLIFAITGQSQNLKLEEIMKGDGFIGVQPVNERWSLDGKKVYFDWNPNNELGLSTYFWEKGMVKPVPASEKEAAFSKLDFKRKPESNLVFYIDKGALYSYSLKNKIAKKLFQQQSPISNLELGSQAGILFFEQNDNIFKYNTQEGSIVQISNFNKGKKEEAIAEKDSFLKNQQQELFQFIRDQEAKQKWNTAKTSSLKSDFPKAYYYGKNDFQSLKINPNGNFATFRLAEQVENKSEKS